MITLKSDVGPRPHSTNKPWIQQNDLVISMYPLSLNLMTPKMFRTLCDIRFEIPATEHQTN